MAISIAAGRLHTPARKDACAPREFPEEKAMLAGKSRFVPVISLLIILVIGSARSVLAHDPGLSSVDLKLENGKLNAHLTFARTDIEAIVQMDVNHDGKISADEFSAVRSRLDAIGREAIEISIDGRGLIPGNVTTTIDDSNAVQFQIAFDGATGAKLQLKSGLISKL